MIETEAQRAATVKQIGLLRKARAEANAGPQDRLSQAYERSLLADIHRMEAELRAFDASKKQASEAALNASLSRIENAASEIVRQNEVREREAIVSSEKRSPGSLFARLRAVAEKASSDASTDEPKQTPHRRPNAKG